MWAIVEKANELALHSLHDTRQRAEHQLQNVIPDYVARGLFVDKTLTADSFKIIPYATNRKLKVDTP